MVSEAMEVMKRHAEAMGSRDPDFIAADYDEDAVVICNLVKEQAVGREAVRNMIAQILDMDFMKNPPCEGNTAMGDDYVNDMEAGEYVLHIFENKSAGMKGVESYCVRNNRIVFESAAIELI